MRWVCVITATEIQTERGSSAALDATLSRFSKGEIVARALDLAGALGLDRDNNWQTVDQWFVGSLPNDLRAEIERIKASDPDVTFTVLEPWQQLLLARRASIVSPDAGDLVIDSDAGRRSYFDACRMINDLSMPPAPELTGDRIADVLIGAANFIPRMWLLNPPNLNNAVARFITFLEELPRAHAECVQPAALLLDRFTTSLGISFDEALALTAFLGYWSIAPSPRQAIEQPDSLWIDSGGWLVNTTIAPETLQRLIDRISRPVEGLPQAVPVAGDEWFDPIPFRDRPLIQRADGRLLVTMPELLMEKSGFDMFWWLTQGPGGAPQVGTLWQEAFGALCEAYVQDILAEISASSQTGYLGSTEWDAGELDALMWAEDRLAVFEVSASQISYPAKMSGDAQRLRRALRTTFVDRNGYRESVSQLARDIEWLYSVRRTRVLPLVPLECVQVIHPVVVAADRTVRTHGIWEYLAQELSERLPETPAWQVAPLAVVALEDLETIQEAVRQRQERLFATRLRGLMQVLRWWQFDSHRYRAFWQLFEDAIPGEFRSSRLREVHDAWRARIRQLFIAKG